MGAAVSGALVGTGVGARVVGAGVGAFVGAGVGARVGAGVGAWVVGGGGAGRLLQYPDAKKPDAVVPPHDHWYPSARHFLACSRNAVSFAASCCHVLLTGAAGGFQTVTGAGGGWPY